MKYFLKLKKRNILNIDRKKSKKRSTLIDLNDLKSSNLNQNMWNDSIVDVTIALSEQELTQKRTYPKLIQVLGDVGGLWRFFSLFLE